MFLLKNLQASLKRNKKRHEGWRTQGPWVLSCLGSRLTKIDVARGKVHDCLWVFTRISTPVGPLSLADLVSHSHAIRIVSVHGYDHECMNMHIICMNVCRKCGKLPKPSQAMRHQLNVMSVLSLASCKPLYRNLTQLNFETGAECSQNVAIYRATKLQTKDDNTCENQKTCWILLDVGLGQIHACFLPECILVTVEPLESSCKNEANLMTFPQSSERVESAWCLATL